MAKKKVGNVGEQLLEAAQKKLDETQTEDVTEEVIEVDDSEDGDENTNLKVDTSNEHPPESEVPEGYEQVEETELVNETVVPLLHQKCHVCRHLMPTLPGKLPKDYGGTGKKKFGKAFDCHVEEGCPARYVRFIYNPFTDETVEKAVEDYLETGSMDELQTMYDKAKEISQDIFEDLHLRVTEMLKA